MSNHQDIKNFYKELAEDTKPDSDYYFKILNKMYEDSKYQHNYSKILKYIIDIHSSDKLDNFNVNINYLFTEYKKRVDNNNSPFEYDKKIKVEELYDHTVLEISRMDYYSNRIRDHQEFTDKKFKTIEDKSKIIEDKSKIIEQQIKNSQMNIVTILGIFTAIVVTFFGGIYSSNKFFDAELIKTLNIYTLLGLYVALFVFWIFIIFSLYKLLYFSIHGRFWV